MDVKIDLSNILEVMNSHFHWLLKNKSRNVVMRGGAGSGKSYSVIQKLLFDILVNYDKSPVNYLLLRKTLPAAKKSIIPLLKHIMKEWGLTSDIVIENKSDHTFTFSNGSVIQIDSLDDPEKIKSIFNISKIMLEESNEFTLEDYLQLNLRLRGNININYQIFILFNPVSKVSWLYDHFYMNDQRNTILHHSTYKNNKFLDNEYIIQLEDLINKDEQFYKIYALGEWGSLEGLVYNNWSVKEWPEEIKYEVYACDFGYTNPTALVRVAVQDNDIYVDEILYKTKWTNSQLIKFIKSNLKPSVIYCDSAEPNRIKEMRNNDINARKSKKEIKDGIDFVKRHHMYITPRSNNIQTELNTYSWSNSKDGKNDKDVPIDFMNHACDAIRYGVYTKWGRKQSFGVIT